MKGFDFYQEDLTKLYNQAKDNVKFLSTILRHLKVGREERFYVYIFRPQKIIKEQKISKLPPRVQNHSFAMLVF